MAFDEDLARRVRALLARRNGITEKRMFGGIAFLLHGKMCCGVLADELVARIGREDHAAALGRPHVRPMDFTGRPIAGFVFVGRRGVKSGAALATWVRAAADYVATLPRGRHTAKRKRATPQRK